MVCWAARAMIGDGLVARWAMIGVVAAVILVRLGSSDFGWRVGTALFAIGATALVLLGASVRVEATCPRTRGRSRETGPDLYEGVRAPHEGEMREFREVHSGRLRSS